MWLAPWRQSRRRDLTNKCNQFGRPTNLPQMPILGQRFALRKALGRISLISGLVLIPNLGWPQSALHNIADTSGEWQEDKSYGRQYFMRAREIQLRWCGYQWPEAEVERRLAVTANIPPLKIGLTGAGIDSFKYRSDNGSEPPKTQQLSGCTISDGKYVLCRLDQTGASVRWHIAGAQLYMAIHMAKSQMNCPKKSEPPDEHEWIAVFRLSKAQ